MTGNKIEEMFSLHLTAIQLLQNALSSSFIDAYVEHMENVVDDYQVRVVDGVPDEVSVKRLQEVYKQLATPLTPEEKRKVSQLVLLKGTQTEPLQPNHQLTPDGIGFLFIYLMEQLYPKKAESLAMLDVSVGMGNLLLTIMTNLKLAGYQSVKGVGVDNDETLLEVASATSSWIGENVALFHQDGLQPMLLEPVDVAVADLPIGYYPDDARATEFLMHVEQGHSYAHHLLMEQSMRYVKECGYGLFLLPSNFLETEQSAELKKWFQECVFLQGIIALPDELFKTEASRKSIVIVQNRSEQTTQAKEVLLAKLTSLTKPQSIQSFFKQFEKWIKENKK